MSPSTGTNALPGVVRQIGFVERDLDAAIATWLAIGVGPWYVLHGIVQDAIYRGQPCAVSTSIAFGNTGDMQIELIHQDDDTPSIYTEFLASGREGFNQFAWWTDDYEATMDVVHAIGWPIVWAGAPGGVTQYAYCEPPAGPAPIIEIMELNDATNGLATLVRDAATNWDGNDPIRSLG